MPRKRLAVAALLVGALALGLVAWWLTEPDDDEPDGPEFTVALGTESGEIRIRKEQGGWEIQLDVDGLPRLDNGEFYQAWLRADDGTLVPVGSFNEADDVILWAGVSPVDYPTFTVTRERADGDQDSSGDRVLSGEFVPAD